MHQTRLLNQKSIKIVPDNQAQIVPGGVITNDQTNLPPNCYIVPMVVLEKPVSASKPKKKP